MKIRSACPYLFPASFLLLFLFSCGSDRTRPTVSIQGESFLLDGEPTYSGRYWEGHRIEGLLLNARMVQGVFDDLNPETAVRWKYPDSGEWDPGRNTDEFVAAMEQWKAHGLLSFTINFQGGSPMGYGNKDWYNSAYRRNGALRPEYLKRMKKILDRALELEMIPIVGLFYFGQDQFLEDEAAILHAVNKAIDWLHEQGYRHILIEVANECDNSKYDHEILQAERIHELIELIRKKEKNGFRYLVSTSYNGNSLPGSNVLQSADFILLHGNGVKDPQRITEMVKQCREHPAYHPMPIVFNEDDHYAFDQGNNHMVSAIKAYASWGYFDFRRGGEAFEEGFQSVPVSWEINSERKKAFFGMVREISGY